MSLSSPSSPTSPSASPALHLRGRIIIVAIIDFDLTLTRMHYADGEENSWAAHSSQRVATRGPEKARWACSLASESDRRGHPVALAAPVGTRLTPARNSGATPIGMTAEELKSALHAYFGLLAALLRVDMTEELTGIVIGFGGTMMSELNNSVTSA